MLSDSPFPLRRIFLSALIGLPAGLSAAIFLHTLDWVTAARSHHLEIIWGLPLAGLFLIWLDRRWGSGSVEGMDLVLREVEVPKKTLPMAMAPLVFAGTLITHLFGGSAGREGTAVQMGASLGDSLLRFFQVTREDRQVLLMAGAGAGFGASLGTPWAGMIFGMEFVEAGALRWRAWQECLVASWVATLISQLLQAPHSNFSVTEIPEHSWLFLFCATAAGVIFGLTAFVYKKLVFLMKQVLLRTLRRPSLIAFTGGLVIVLLSAWEGSYRYLGLGLPDIQEALAQGTSFFDPLYKIFFTALTLGSGFKGGEFIPLVYVGATLGSALATVFSLPVSLLAPLGFAAVFAGAANTPLACAVMAMELFGWRIGGFALLTCGASFLCSGACSIYSAQQTRRKRFFIKQ